MDHDKVFICAKAALDKKAENLKVLDLRGLSSFTDTFIICSAMTERQVHAIVESIEAKMKEAGQLPSSREGAREARWVLLDYDEVVVHVFLDALRDYYDIEKLWSNAPRVPLPGELFEPAARPLSTRTTS